MLSSLVVRLFFPLLFNPESGTDARLYVGIPFAEPPIGALRFRPPVFKVQLNTTTFDAGNYGKACIQLVCPRPIFQFA